MLDRLRKKWLVQSVPYKLTRDEAALAKFMSLSAWRRHHCNEEWDRWDHLRTVHFMRLIEHANELTDGDYIEMGTRSGGTAKLILELMNRDRSLYCFDTFSGFTQRDLDQESKIRSDHGFTTDSIGPIDHHEVRVVITGGVADPRLKLVPGVVPASLAPFSDMRWRFAHLDLDLYEPTRTGLEWLWPRIVPGGVVLFHDYDALPGISKAVNQVLMPHGVVAMPMSDRFGSAAVIKPFTDSAPASG